MRIMKRHLEADPKVKMLDVVCDNVTHICILCEWILIAVGYIMFHGLSRSNALQATYRQYMQNLGSIMFYLFTE